MKNWLPITLIAIAIYLVWKKFTASNDLTAEMQEVEWKQRINEVATATNNASQIPMATIGGTPFAGIWYDPFNNDNPASQPSALEFMKASGGLLN